MLYMVVERFKNKDAKPVYLRFRKQGRLMPDGVHYVKSWVDHNYTQCFQIMECEDYQLLQQWIDNWKDLVDFEVIPVQSSEEATKGISPMLEAMEQNTVASAR